METLSIERTSEAPEDVKFIARIEIGYSVKEERIVIGVKTDAKAVQAAPENAQNSLMAALFRATIALHPGEQGELMRRMSDKVMLTLDPDEFFQSVFGHATGDSDVAPDAVRH